MSDRLKGKVLLITGSARGIGAQVARSCSTEGAKLLLVDSDPAVELVADELPGGIAIVDDITRVGAAEAAVDMAVQRFGSVTGLVNNAVHIPPLRSLLDTTQDDFKRTLGVNVEAPLVWCRAVLPHLLEAGNGSIVNLTSIEATFVGPGGGVYHLSKAALLALTRVIAVEYGRRGIRCNAVSPGSVDTTRLREIIAESPGLERTLLGLNYAGRLGRPEDIAACCVHLLSDESAFTNGANHIIDGGRTAATLGPEGALA